MPDDFEKLKLDVKAGFTAGNFKVSGGGSVSSDGEVGGTVTVDLMQKSGMS